MMAYFVGVGHGLIVAVLIYCAWGLMTEAKR